MSDNTDLLFSCSDYKFNFKYREYLINFLVISIYSYSDRYSQDTRFKCIISKSYDDPNIVVEDLCPGADEIAYQSVGYSDYMDELLTYIRHRVPTIISNALGDSKGEGVYPCVIYLYGALTREQYEEKRHKRKQDLLLSMSRICFP